MDTDGDRGRTLTGSRVFRRRQLPPGLAVAAAFFLSACHLMGVPKTGPEGRSMYDTDLQRLAREEAFIEAVELTDPEYEDDIGDELLRLMYRGLLLHYAGQYEASNEVLQRAEEIIDDRFTKSVSRALLSVVTNDRALAWVPGDTERMMVNFYGALNYLALADAEDAAVEARRLSRLLELGEDDEIDAAEIEMRRTLRYFAAAVFEASGNHNDAAVAYRHVWSPGDLVSDTPLRPRFVDLYGVEMPAEEPREMARDFDTVLDSIMATVGAGGAEPAGAAAPDDVSLADSPSELDGPPEADDLALPNGLPIPDSLAFPGSPVAPDSLLDPSGPALPDSLAAPDSLLDPSGPALPDSLVAPDSLLGPDSLAVPDSLLELPIQVAGSGGDVVILLERGMVAHRVERSSNVPVFPPEADALQDPDSDVRFAAASCVASRGFKDRYDFTSIFAESGADWRGEPGEKCVVPQAGRRDSDDSDDSDESDESDESNGEDEVLFLMRVAWPEMVSAGLPTDVPVLGMSIAAARPLQVASLEAAPGGAIAAPDDPGTALLPGAAAGEPDLRPTVAKPAMWGSVSGAVTEEFEEQLGGILIKMVARSALKYELARGIEKELDKKNEALGDIAFLTANAAAALFERADTRSWHLLPDEVSVVRLRLPAGVHPLTLEVDTGGDGTRLVDLGELEVRDGSVHVLSARVWP